MNKYLESLQNTPQMVFPQTIEYDSSMKFQHFGLTKREWFAGMAMNALLSGATPGSYTIKAVTQTSFQIADQMMEP